MTVALYEGTGLDVFPYFGGDATAGVVGSPGTFPTTWWAAAQPLNPAAVWTPNGEVGTNIPAAHGTGRAVVKNADVGDLPTDVPGLAGEWGTPSMDYAHRLSLTIDVPDTVRQGALEVVHRADVAANILNSNRAGGGYPFALWEVTAGREGPVSVPSAWSVSPPLSGVLQHPDVGATVHLLYQFDRDAGTVTAWFAGQAAGTAPLDDSVPLTVDLSTTPTLLVAWYDQPVTDGQVTNLSQPWTPQAAAAADPFGHPTPGLGVASLHVAPAPMEPPSGYGDYLIRQAGGIVPGPPTLDAAGRPVGWEFRP